jgi:hypothetical protein
MVLDGKRVFIDKTRAIVSSIEYHSIIGDFSEGLAIAYYYDNGVLVYKGFIDKTGKEVISLNKYSSSYNFSEGLARVAISDYYGDYYYGFIDKTGTIVK